MKCPHCHTYVTKIPVSWKCPRCGEKLPEPGKLFYLKEHLTEYLNQKGAIFWSVWFGITLGLIGVIEVILGRDFLVTYLSDNLLISIIFIFFGGMILDMVMKINLPLRSMSGSDFIIKERLVIRNIRKTTNITLVVAFVFCLYWLKPRLFFLYFPSYVVVTSFFLAFSWAVVGLFLDARMTEDVRFRLYMDRLGITSLKRYRKIGTISIGILVICSIGYNILLTVHNLWGKISDLAIIGSIIFFIRQYFDWLV